MEQRRPSSPFAQVRRKLPQFSVRTILLITVVFAIACTVLVAALRTAPIANEIAMLTGRPAPNATGGHFTHLVFLLLCYCSTMLLALVVQVAKGISVYIARSNIRHKEQSETVDPFAE